MHLFSADPGEHKEARSDNSDSDDVVCIVQTPARQTGKSGNPCSAHVCTLSDRFRTCQQSLSTVLDPRTLPRVPRPLYPPG